MLDSENLKKQLLSLMQVENATPEQAADGLAKAIDAYIRTATVTVTTQVTGTSATGGPVSGVGQGTGTLS